MFSFFGFHYRILDKVYISELFCQGIHGFTLSINKSISKRFLIQLSKKSFFGQKKKRKEEEALDWNSFPSNIHAW
jgi:hypothetical protein